jgi:hypothetical protein
VRPGKVGVEVANCIVSWLAWGLPHPRHDTGSSLISLKGAGPELGEVDAIYVTMIAQVLD